MRPRSITSTNNFVTVILEDGSFWTVYGAKTASTTTPVFQITGFMQGSASVVSNGSYTSTDAKDFGFSPAVAATLSGSYVAGVSLKGQTKYVNGTSTSFDRSAVPDSIYPFDTPAQISSIEGPWAITLVSGTTLDTANINISSVGAIGASTSGKGCSFTGSVAPRGSGKNVFDVSLTMGAAPCMLARQTVRGIAVSYPLGAGKQELIVTLVNSDRTTGIRASGVR